MNEEIKMSDYFVLPMICEDGHSFIFSNDLSHSMMPDYFNPRMMENKKAVAHAINNHDRLTQENQRLIEALNGLYEAFYSEYSSGALTYKQDVEMANTLELLTELKGGEDE